MRIPRPGRRAAAGTDRDCFPTARRSILPRLTRFPCRRPREGTPMAPALADPPSAVVRPVLPARRARRLPATTPRLSVVIVNYRRWEAPAFLARQLRSSAVLRRGVAEVVVVDNPSGPHRLAARMRRWPGVSLRRWGRNRGFARAVNEGCRLSRGDWLLLLNPDMTVPDGFLDAALERVAHWEVAEPQAGIVGFPLRNPAGRPPL